jgi:AraC-like DNA-binding protein
MIVVQVVDPTLRRAALRAARMEEDVVTGPLTSRAIDFGFPRLVVRGPQVRRRPVPDGVAVCDIDADLLRAWESRRRTLERPPTRLEYLTAQMSALVEERASRGLHADRILAELSRAAGARLPGPLVGFARRVMDFPWRYRSLHAVADASGTSRGALKARFRRRGLPTPFAYLRWYRVLALSGVLCDSSVTVAAAARRLGFTSDGNLCRMLGSLTGMTPTEVRSEGARRELVLRHAWLHLSPEQLEAWASLDELFVRQVA